MRLFQQAAGVPVTILPILITVSVSIAMSTAKAVEPQISEMRKDVAGIGRVFLSKAERRSLNELRHVPALSQNARDIPAGLVPSATDRQESRSRAAGYIVPSTGLPYQWIDGEFHKSSLDNIHSASSPGNILIVKHGLSSPVLKQSDASSVKSDRHSDNSGEPDAEADDGGD